MKVCTRFAPTISGHLHIGSLYNALLNYLYAKKYDGLFKLRLDGIDLTEERKIWQNSIQQDLDLFGLHPDEVLRQSDRLEIYKEAAFNLARTCDRSYHCDCTVQDLLKRAHKDDSNFYHLYRPEKYPPYCKIAQIKVYGTESEDNIAADCPVEVSHDVGNTAIHLTCRIPRANNYWEPIEVGYGFHPVRPFAVIDLGSEKSIRGVEIVWKDRPVLEYEICIENEEQKRCPVIRAAKRDRYFVDYKPGQPFPSLTSDRHSFAVVNTRYVHLFIKSCPVPVDRPYFYDYHCRELKKNLDLSDPKATMRLKFDPKVEFRFLNFVTEQRFPLPSDDDVKPDSCWWYNGQPNLVFTSPFDDHDLGITHLIRGEDIYPFLLLEAQVAMALDRVVEKQTYHGMVINSQGYKYSKFIKSTPVREYLKDGITPNMILTYLAYKIGMVPDLKNILTLKDLIDIFDCSCVSRKTIVIDELKMIEEIKTKSMVGDLNV